MFQPFPVKINPTKSAYSSGLSFTTMTAEGEPVRNFTSCKEYILDDVNDSITSDKIGFFQTGKKAFLDETRLLVVDHPNVERAFNILNFVEEYLEIPCSIINSCGDNCYVFRGSPRWMISPPMLSMYALLIRISKPIDEILDEKYYGSDSNILNNGARAGILNIVNYGDKKIFGENIKSNWPKNNYNIHNWGIASFGAKIMKNEMPKWYECIK